MIGTASVDRLSLSGINLHENVCKFPGHVIQIFCRALFFGVAKAESILTALLNLYIIG